MMLREVVDSTRYIYNSLLSSILIQPIFPWRSLDSSCVSILLLSLFHGIWMKNRVRPSSLLQLPSLPLQMSSLPSRSPPSQSSFQSLPPFQIVLKVTAFTFSGFWQSRRNRIDLVITCLGLTWILIHFLPSPPFVDSIAMRKFSYSIGYIIVILRFFTIASESFHTEQLFILQSI